MDTEKRPIEVIQRPSQSNTLGAIAATLGGGALLGVAWNAVNNTLSRYLGNIGANIGAINNTLPGVAPVIAPTIIPAPVVHHGGHGCHDGGSASKELVDAKVEIATLKAEKYADKKIEALSDKYVTKTEAALIAENGQLKAQIYTDAKVESVNNRVCELEKNQAVNAAEDRAFRRYVNDEFVHQPKAHMKHKLLETTDECCCGRHSHHHHHQGAPAPAAG